MEVETQRVWDYANDGYIHRLIQSKGKMIEIPSVPNSNPTAIGGPGGPDTEAHASQDKIEAMGLEYSYLLASQLDSQRAYYDRKVLEMQKQLDQTLILLHNQSEKSELQGNGAQEIERKMKDLLQVTIPVLERDRARDKQRSEISTSLARQLKSELSSEKEINKGLHINISRRNEDFARLQLELEDTKEQLRDMMFALTARDRIEQDGGGELSGGSVSLPSPSKPSRRKKK